MGCPQPPPPPQTNGNNRNSLTSQNYRDSLLGAPGAASSMLAEGVGYLSPRDAVFEAMVAGWGTQQRSRSLSPVTIEKREYTLRRFVAFTNEFPWSWGPGDVEGWTS